MKGKVSMYDKENGFGFILGDNGIEYYTRFEGLSLEEKFKTEKGMSVIFDLQEGLRGDEAINIKLL